METYEDAQRIKTCLRKPSSDERYWPGPQIEYCGHLRNLFVTKTDGKLVITGSLAKFHNGDNIKNVGLEEMRRAIKGLSKLLRLPIEQAYVSRIDIGFNLALEMGVRQYLFLLQYAQGYNKTVIYRNGRAFCQTEKTMTFYDKNIEAAKRGLGSNLYCPNLLRYELRLWYPARILGIEGGIVVADLLDKDIANWLIALWVREYFRIVKNRTITFPVKIQSQKDFRDFLELMGAKALGGEASLFRLADTLTFPDSKNPSKIRCDIKRIIGQIHSNMKLVSANELESELDDLILITAMKYSS